MNRTQRIIEQQRAARRLRGQATAQYALTQLHLKMMSGDNEPGGFFYIPDYVFITKFLIVRLLGIRSMIEIGVLAGYSAFMFASAFPELDYLGIDNMSYLRNNTPMTFDHAKGILSAFPNMKFQLCDSQALTSLPQRVDMVHVDGDHSYAGHWHDMLLAKDVTDVILVDDYWTIEECRRATGEFIREHGWMLLELDAKQSLVVKAE